MATSVVTLRVAATLPLTRPYKLSPLHNATNLAVCPLAPSVSLRDIGKTCWKISPLVPLYNRRFFCASAETEAVVAEGTTPSSDIPNADSSVSPPSTDPVKDAADVLEIRVGRIIKAWQHPEADTLYVEEVDVGEPETRTICSGLVKYIPLDNLQDRKVIVLANLKPRNMRGVKSNGMLLCASDVAHENVELLVPPEDSIVGERIWFGLEEDKENQPPTAKANQVQKKKIWESVQPKLKTDGSCVASLGEHIMRTSAGAVVSTSLQNANIS